jgi:hypothetical protein
MATPNFSGYLTATTENFPLTPGAYQITSSGSFPIYGSLNLADYQLQNKGVYYILMPGYITLRNFYKQNLKI